MQLAARNAPNQVYTVWQDLAGDLWCDCREFEHEAARAPKSQTWRRGCRHTEIVETARVLAAAWISEDTQDRARVLRLTPPPGSRPPTRLYTDD